MGYTCKKLPFIASNLTWLNETAKQWTPNIGHMYENTQQFNTDCTRDGEKTFSLHLINEKQCIVPYSFQKFHRRFYNAVILYKCDLGSPLQGVVSSFAFQDLARSCSVHWRWLISFVWTSFSYWLNDCGIQKKTIFGITCLCN